MVVGSAGVVEAVRGGKVVITPHAEDLQARRIVEPIGCYSECETM